MGVDTKTLGAASALVEPRISALEEKVDDLPKAFVPQGRVDTVADLADIEDPEVGWVYLVGLESDPNKPEYWYTAAGAWEYLGQQATVATLSTAGIVKPDGLTIAVDENGVISATTYDVTSWRGIRDIVRQGQAARFFQVGDLLECEKNGSKIQWVVLGIDQDTPADSQFTHSLTLGAVDVYTEMQFDNKEAIFAFPEGLAAGTYHFTISVQPWVAGDVGKTVQFTIANAIPENGVIVLNNAYNATMIGSTLSVYASNVATTAAETASISEGSDGTDLGSVGNAISGNTNSIQRAYLGSNKYSESAIRQWLNSDKAAGNVWTPQTKWDRPPSWATTTDGFLRGIDPDFAAVLGTCNKRTALNTISDGGGYMDSTERVFLLSRTEVYGGLNNNVSENAPYDYFKNYSDLSSAGTGADSNRTKYRNNVAKYWWLRSPYTGYAYSPYNVSPSGTIIDYVSATNSYGVVPACCII